MSEAADLSGERNTLRRRLLDKKNELQYLERQSAKVGEIRALLAHLMQGLQETEDLHFADEPEKLDASSNDTRYLVTVVRSGIDRFIAKHERLASRYELELSKNLYGIDQRLSVKRGELEREVGIANSEKENYEYQKKLLDAIEEEKHHIMVTIKMRQDALERNMEANRSRSAQIERRVADVEDDYHMAMQQLTDLDNTEADLGNKKQERDRLMKKQTEVYDASLARVTKLRRQVKVKAQACNESNSMLDKARARLLTLSRKVGSYHDNLKSQILLDEEVENKRLRAVLKTDKEAFQIKLDRHKRETGEIHVKIDALNVDIERLNHAIIIMEQKLQAQMVRIPDFKQIEMALEREVEQSRIANDFVMKRKYMLDDVREAARKTESDEIEASKVRVRLLALAMPSEEQEREQENQRQFEALMEENRQRTHAFADSLGVTSRETLPTVL